MNLAEFCEDYDGAPITEEEFAAGAALVEDAPDLAAAGQAYIDARHVFFSTLSKYDVEMG